MRDSADGAGTARLNAGRWNGDALLDEEDGVAVEVPVALVYNGVSHAVLLATPCDLEDFAYGFTLSEAIATDAGELLGVEVGDRHALGVTIDVRLTSRAFARLSDRRRTLAGATGCGLCGVESLEQATRAVDPVPSTIHLDPKVVPGSLAQLIDAQPMRAETGSVHVAAWIGPDGNLQLAREDVGRHNALDKLLGARARGTSRDGFAVISSRASYEMVLKAATMRVEMLVAVSAPTSLAVQTAETVGMTLVGFARGRQFKVYTRPERFRTGPR